MTDKTEVAADLQNKYDRYYDGPSRWRELGAAAKVANIENLCRGFLYDEVLEIGAGEGSVLARLDAKGFGRNLYAVEISESGLQAIRRREISRLRESHSFDGYHTPYPDKRFDLVVATHVLEHVEHERLFLQELKRVGKSVFVEVPLEDTLRVARAVENDIGHINFYSRATVTALVQSVGFDVVRSQIFDHPFDVTLFKFGVVKGLPRQLIRRLMLRTAPIIAEKLVVYHYAMLLKPRAIS